MESAIQDDPSLERLSRPAAQSSAVRWIGVGVSVAVLWMTLRSADLGRSAELVAAIGAPMMAIALVPNFVARACQAEASRRIFAALDRPAPIHRYVVLTLATEAVLMSVPVGIAIAESLTFVLLQRWCGVPAPEGVVGLSARRSLVLLANAAYVALAFALGSDHLGRASVPLLGVPWLPRLVLLMGSGLLAASFLISGALRSGAVAGKALALLRRVPSDRFRAALDARAAGFSATDRHAAWLFGRRRGALALSALFLLGMWIAEGLETLLLLSLLGIDLSFSEVLSFEVVLAFLRTVAFMVPAGLGVQDAGYVAFFGALGVPDAVTAGAAFVLLKRAKELVFVAVGLLLFFIGRRGRPDVSGEGR